MKWREQFTGYSAWFIRSRSRSWWLAVLLLAAGIGCASGPPPPHLLLITIDTLRSDHMGAYGYSRPTSPRMDALAGDGALFRHVFAPVPRTTQSVATIHTGLYPKNHRARGLFSYLAPENTTLAEILRHRGYATAAIVSNMFLQPGQGFEQGFDFYSNPRHRFDGNSAEEITREALDWLSAAPASPLFLWVHYLDPHWSYEPSSGWLDQYDPGFVPSPAFEAMEAGTYQKGELIFQNPLTEADRAHLLTSYDGEIAGVDLEIGRLLDGLPDAIRANLLIVLTSDHGESLGEHDYFYAHGEYLYDETLQVPLMFVFPERIPSGLTVDRMASLLDVTPTILELLRLPPDLGMDGVSLFRREPSGGFVPSGGHPQLFAETDYQLIHSTNPRFHLPGVDGRWTSLREGSRKLIRIPRPEGPFYELFDLDQDPGEKQNLVPDRTEVPADLLQTLTGWTDHGEGTGRSLEDSLTPEQRERLRSLGYLQ